MAQTLLVYAVAALLLVASTGPVLQGVRDASLADFEALDEWRSLEDFPFLKQVQPYLPPLVVDWVIVQRDAPEGLPAGVDYRFDDDGRVVLMWPDGCEETQERYETDSRCAPPPPDPCAEDPSAEGCDPCADPANATEACVPPECPPGQLLDPDWPDADPACVPDPACTGPNENGSRPARCPPGPGTETPVCPEDHVEAYDGSCIPVRPTLLSERLWENGDTQNIDRTIPLKVPFENLSLEVEWSGLTSPGYRIKLTHPEPTSEEGTRSVCWQTDDGGSPGDGCHIMRSNGLGSGGSRTYVDLWDGPLPVQNYTLTVEPTSSASGDHDLRVRLYGSPYEADDAGKEQDAE